MVTVPVQLTVVLSPLQSWIWLFTFTPNILTMQKAFSDFRARLPFSYIYLLIKGSIKFRLIIITAFILLTIYNINYDTAYYCVLLGVTACYIYMVRIIKFNLVSWLYRLTLLCLTLSRIFTFWFLIISSLSLILPILLPKLASKLLLLLTVIEASF